MLGLGPGSGADVGVGSGAGVGAGVGTMGTHSPAGSGSLAAATGVHEQQNRDFRPGRRQPERQRMSSRRVLGPAQGRSD